MNAPGAMAIMNLLFYATIDNRASRKVFAIMRLQGKAFGLEFYRDIIVLMRRLRQPAKELAAAVLFTASVKDINDLIAVRHFLDDMPVILVLPNDSEEFIRKGHLLRPRFLTFADSSPKEIGTVLNNMLKKASIDPVHHAVSRTLGVDR
jgi:hypothetical protein